MCKKDNLEKHSIDELCEMALEVFVEEVEFDLQSDPLQIAISRLSREELSQFFNLSKAEQDRLLRSKLD